MLVYTCMKIIYIISMFPKPVFPKKTKKQIHWLRIYAFLKVVLWVLKLASNDRF